MSTTGPARGGCADATDREVRGGYLFWFIAVGGVLLVEALGALAHWLHHPTIPGTNVYLHFHLTIPWTTISGMVGYLENRWPATAVIVVAIISPAAFYALGPVKQPRAVASRRGRLGRWWIRSGDPKPPLTHYDAWIVLGASVAAAVIAPLVIDWLGWGTDYHRAFGIYGALFLFGIVLPTLLSAVFRREVGFTSLFCTIAHLRSRDDLKAALASVALTAGLGILVVHLAFYPWPDITKEPVLFAGLSATQAQDQATAVVASLRKGTGALVYSAQARQVVGGHDAWVVYFSTQKGDDSGCTVIVRGSQAPQASAQCSVASPA
jgi:hypothetical protein